jgi:hypothetical protein
LNFLATFFFLAGFLTGMNSLPFLLRLSTLRVPSLPLNCERAITSKAAVGDENPKTIGRPTRLGYAREGRRR